MSWTPYGSHFLILNETYFDSLLGVKGAFCTDKSWLKHVHTGVVDNEGDEFFDAGAEPSSPSFLSRAVTRSSSSNHDDSRLIFADPDVESVSFREASFKDAPGPSELWPSKGGGKPDAMGFFGVGTPCRIPHLAWQSLSWSQTHYHTDDCDRTVSAKCKDCANRAENSIRMPARV